ncbi:MULTISPECIES: DUF456 domain-containing protein [unclassified Pseudodesulfovibrio]|uniref:DUF456 domain-containing protein n=1 Tax=unclassified Pseudodesulfovibrio TaxID=2661612 RepID=UPI000FEBC2B1|nr:MULTISPECIES: DUF456 domain-containing protein [unclassified Pseudodesulfovibrio]MCJ2164282.1 DUF456 domain-containing protein [Pseudodesulfovibrio sp. S3-i]RWU05096.1 DUF456 domain-containing protein [Pseudodesulfovibrio sp. S3]
MEYVWAILLIIGLAFSQVLQIFSLPANWVALGLVSLWKYVYPESMEWSFIIGMAVVAVVAEVLEFGLQAWGAGRYGASTRGNVGGIIGAIAGAIFGASFLFGLGALIGALGGAYLGCLVAEMPGRSKSEAFRAAKGAFVGKALGFTVKTAIGAVIVILSIPKVWP